MSNNNTTPPTPPLPPASAASAPKKQLTLDQYKELQGYFQALHDAIRDDHPNAAANRKLMGCMVTLIKADKHYKEPLEALKLKATLDVLHKQSGSTDPIGKWVVENVPQPGEIAFCIVPASQQPTDKPTPPVKGR